MSDLFSIVLPTFGLIGLGWLAGQLKLLGNRAGDGLSDYVFLLAVPSLIFRTLSEGGTPADNPWGYWIAYFGGVAVVWTAAMLLATRVFGRDRREAAIHGFSAGQSNTVLVGVPLILEVYGDDGAIPLFLLLAIHLPIMMSAAAILIETASADAKGFQIAKKLARTIVTHPIILALVAGLIAQRLGMKPSGAAKSFIDQLAATASPCALVAMGLALKRFGFVSDIRAVAAISALKLVAHPFLVWLLAFHILTVPPVWAGVAVLFAAMPCGINAYLIAARYKVAEPTASAAVAISTAISVLTVSGWLWVIGAV
ncbi:AEC family transporter [Chelatococcus sambhunathii]|uniref:AEC family transporter n=1 Tax=Chelatococcus sambhunathii TaxID=363953 RepID=A0ABU1DKH2_9HYPH|nr:AEC family transporter [Chelatococcus sambhunathii]MDR4308632.1 AEC family transporter [Chelatococcus sambhunathii]